MGGSSAIPSSPIHLLREATSCELWLQFDFSQSAGNYSQLSGVLAGFAFLAIMLVLSRQHRRVSERDAVREYEQDNRFVTALACACLGLVTAATLFSLLSGEEGCALISGRALSKEVLAGVAFFFSVVRSWWCCKARACPSPAATIGVPISKSHPVLTAKGRPTVAIC
jgi:hypothetical protein